MMGNTNPAYSILDALALELDLPQELKERAKARYTRLAEFVKLDSGVRFRVDTRLYPQGSIYLGTAVRPIKQADQFDVDIVYRRDLRRISTSQDALMESIGNQLRDFINSIPENEEKPNLELHRRCWRLQYLGDFHIDVLPAIPDDLPHQNNNRDIDEAILIPDKELHDWQHSNPRGFANWFFEQDSLHIQEQLRTMAKAAQVDVEQIPIESVKTPLRRSIQLLKRHRDIKFQGSPDDKPISIIITTLAAKAYQNEPSVEESLFALVSRMDGFIEDRNGISWVANPVNPDGENFADNWQKHPQREVFLRNWLAEIKQEVRSALSQKGIDQVANMLSTRFGESAVTRAVSRIGKSLSTERDAGHLRMASRTGSLGSGGLIKVKKHTFYG